MCAVVVLLVTAEWAEPASFSTLFRQADVTACSDTLLTQSMGPSCTDDQRDQMLQAAEGSMILLRRCGQASAAILQIAEFIKYGKQKQ